ncbi:hypothetical protein V8J36_03800 [Frigidibacter sp. MR17.14]|uniref:hypothetical protein n=1 Tax=Frigidibacter sp. MR17.14 TaxID=3126509 RepID=UPI003012AAD4
MSIEPIGLAALAVVAISFFLDYGTMVIVLVTASVLGAAAAIIIGGANIQPAHLFLGAVGLNALMRPRQCAGMLLALRPGKPGFWLLCLVAYALVSAFFFPRIMAGSTLIFPIGSTSFDATGSTVPLAPVSGNITQSIYIVGSFAVFLIVTSCASDHSGFRTAVAAILSYAVANAAFGLLDLATYLTGTQGLLEVIRNAKYAMHTETEMQGLKRVVGSFTEASSFGRSSIGALGFVATLWLCGIRPLYTGGLAILTFLLAVMSTSSAALVSLPVMMALLYLTVLSRSARGLGTRGGLVLIVALPLVALAAVLGVLAHPGLSAVIGDYLNALVFSKAGSDSGVERSSWNAAALQNFIDSGGLGVGLGSIRTSSLAMALVGGVGAIGTLFYLGFVAMAFLRNPGVPGGYFTDVRTAARNGCIGMAVGDLMLSSNVDQGILFYALAGLAAARPEYRGASRTPVAPSPSSTVLA